MLLLLKWFAPPELGLNDELTLSSYTQYHIVQNGGGIKLWRIGNFKNLVGKTLASNKLSLSSLIKIRHSHTTLNLNPQSFI